MQTNPDASSAAQQRMAQVWAKYDCNPIKSLVGTLGQASVFMTFFFALKALAAAKVCPLFPSWNGCFDVVVLCICYMDCPPVSW